MEPEGVVDLPARLRLEQLAAGADPNWLDKYKQRSRIGLCHIWARYAKSCLASGGDPLLPTADTVMAAIVDTCSSLQRPKEQANKIVQVVRQFHEHCIGGKMPGDDRLDERKTIFIKQNTKRPRDVTPLVDANAVLTFLHDNDDRFGPQAAFNDAAAEADLRTAAVVTWFLALPSRAQTMAITTYNGVEFMTHAFAKPEPLVDVVQRTDTIGKLRALLQNEFRLRVTPFLVGHFEKEDDMGDGKPRVVQHHPMATVSAAASLLAYAIHQRHVLGRPVAAASPVIRMLATSRRNEPLAADRISNVLKEATDSATGHRLGARAWRPTTTVRMFENGDSVAAVMAAGGWNAESTLLSTYNRHAPNSSARLLLTLPARPAHPAQAHAEASSSAAPASSLSSSAMPTAPPTVVPSEGIPCNLDDLFGGDDDDCFPDLSTTSGEGPADGSRRSQF